MADEECAERSDIAAALGGDSDAYGRLVRRHQDEIAAYMWRFTRRQADWEELVQEVFVEAYFSLGSYRAQAPWIHWLKKIATRVGYGWWKQESRRRAAGLVPLAQRELRDTAVPAETAREAAEVVHTMLARLGPRDRLVLTLLHLEGASVAEAAAMTGWSQTMVKVQAHRARKRLEKLLVAEDRRG